MNRRDCLGAGLGAGVTLALGARASWSADQGGVIRRAIPSSGELLPVVGLGSSATFGQVARSDDVSALRTVMQTLVERGGRVFDTAPGYGASEEVAGKLAREAGITKQIFWATKVNAVPRGATTASASDARAQIEASFARFGAPKIDLIQVHNMADVPTQLGVLKALKREGRVRYIGVTTTFPEQYSSLIETMRSEPLDFIGIDYAIDNRDVEQTILPLAQERKIGVLAYLPFGRTSLFRRVGNRPLPDWAKEFDATTWAQFFLKYIISHPAITVVTPATSQAKNMADNIGGGMGRLPSEATRKRMVELIDALPAPPARQG